MNDFTAHRMMLDLLDQRDPIDRLPSVANLQIDENVLADSTRKQVLDILPLEFEVGGSLGGAIDDRRDRATEPHFADCVAASFLTRARREFDLLGHNFRWLDA